MTAKLLVVEDEEHLAFALDFNLKEEGYLVTIASTVSEAQAQITQNQDLIILDVMLPDGSGFDFCKTLRTEGNRTPVLFLTAKGSLDDIVNGLEAGGDDYMTKPFALQELLGRVSAILRRRQWDGHPAPNSSESSPSLFRFGDHLLNLESREVYAFGKRVGLTDLEFRILKYFLDNRQRVVSREELLANVWEVCPDTNTRTVDVFVARLRRLFESDPARPCHFLTVRGAGYRFVP